MMKVLSAIRLIIYVLEGNNLSNCRRCRIDSEGIDSEGLIPKGLQNLDSHETSTEFEIDNDFKRIAFEFQARKNIWSRQFLKL